jgi:hypothetical protein
MIQRVWIVCSVVAGLAACVVLPTIGLVQIYERGTGKTGRGEVNALTKTLFATFDGRNFEGSYAVIPDSASIGIISSHGLMNSSQGIVSGSANSFFSARSSNYTSYGVLKAADGDLVRCEFRGSGRQGFGVCTNDRDSIWDIIIP